VDTSAFTQGSPLYLGVGGTMQTNLPLAPTNGVFIGIVERVGVNNGQIYVAIQNYQELAELSDVYTPSPSNDYVLTYVAANSRWEALPAAGGSGSITNIKSGSSRLIVTNGAGPEVSFGLDVSGLATGTPVYTESDPVWVAASNTVATNITANRSTATNALAIARIATNSAAAAQSTANAASATGTAAYALAANARSKYTPVEFNRTTAPFTNDLAINIFAYDQSSPGYYGLSNALIGEVAYFDPFQASNGDPLIYDLPNKVWRYGVLGYAEVSGNASNLNGLAASSYLTLSDFQSSQATTNTLLRRPATGTTNVLILIDGAGIITTQRILQILVQ